MQLNNNNVNNNISKFCKRKFSARQSRWRLEKICKIKNTTIIKQESKETKETNITNNIIKFGSEDIINILTKKQIANIKR
jgi:hypothetical protein